MSTSYKAVAAELVWNNVYQILTSAVIIAIAYVVKVVAGAQRPYKGVSLIGAADGLSKLKKRYIQDSAGMIRSGLNQTRGIFQVFTDSGPRIVLPATYVNDMRQNPSLSFTEFVREDFMADYPAFQAFHAGVKDEVFQEAVRNQLIQSLAKTTGAISEEASLVLNEVFPLGENAPPDFALSSPLHSAILQVISRLSARVFLGLPMCRDPTWLQLSVNFTVDSMKAIKTLRAYPPFLRPVMHRLLPEIRKVTEEQDLAYKMVQQERERRAAVNREEEKLGGTPSESYPTQAKSSNTLQWMEESAAAKNRSVDATIGLLTLSISAIHTTSNALTFVMFDLVTRPDLISNLRKEIISVMGKENEGESIWQKTTLHKLRLMDSVLKESQRLAPISVLSMRRKTLREVKLSDGAVLPPNAQVGVSTEAFKDASVYDNPEEFDGYRFLRLREQPGNEHKWQYVTTSPEHFGFGHGKHACPGRFFASNEMKIALVHLLMKYDWELPGKPPTKVLYVENYAPDPTARLLYRTRKPEISL